PEISNIVTEDNIVETKLPRVTKPQISEDTSQFTDPIHEVLTKSRSELEDEAKRRKVYAPRGRKKISRSPTTHQAVQRGGTFTFVQPSSPVLFSMKAATSSTPNEQKEKDVTTQHQTVQRGGTFTFVQPT